MIRPLPLFMIALLFTMPVALATPALSDSFWDHNGSLMRLQAQGNQRWLTYERPRQGIASQGVMQGTLLFDGTRVGDRYEGTARVFSAACGAPLPYFVSGFVIGPDRIVMEGQRPVHRNCQPTGEFAFDRLEFTYVSSDLATLQQPAPQPIGKTPPGPNLDATQVFGLAAQTLGDVFAMMTPEQVRQSIRSVTFGPSDFTCSGPNIWTAFIVFPEIPAYGYGGSGELAFDDATGVLSCTTIPMD